MKKNIKRITACCIITCILSTGVCNNTEKITAKASESVLLSDNIVKIGVNQRTAINIDNANNTTVKWVVDKKYQKYIAIAGSGRKCYIRGKKAGTAYVKATVGKATYKCKVIVKKGVGLSDISKSLIQGKSFELGLYGTTRTARWKSSNSKVVKITKAGKNRYKVAGVKAGTAYVTATIGRKVYKCRVVVKGKISTPKLSASKMSVNYNQTRTLKLTGTTSKITWKVSDPSMLKLTKVSNGTVKLQGLKVGKTKITATYGKITKTCDITVAAVSAPYVNTSNLKLTIGTKKPIASYVTGSKVGITSWVSKNPKVVDIDDFGNLVAKGVGSTTVTITVDGIDLYLGVNVMKSENVRNTDNKGETEKPGNQEAEKNTEKVTERNTEKITEKVTENVTENVTEKNTEKVTEKNTEKETETEGFVFDGYWPAEKTVSGGWRFGLYISNAVDRSEFEVYSEKGYITISDPSYETAPNGTKLWNFSFVARKKCVDTLILKVHNKVVKTCTVTVTSDDTEFLKFDSWLDTKQSEFLSNGTWTDSMTKIEKLAALGQWTLDNYDYVANNENGVYSFMYGESTKRGGNCTCTADLICCMAKKLGLKAIIDISLTVSTHEYAKVYDENGKAWGIDAGYSGKAGHRGTVSVFEYKQ